MVSCQTALQVNVDEHYRGRVLSIYVMCFFAGTPIGALVGGIVAEFVGLRATIVGSAVLLAGCIGLTLLRYPGLRVLDESMLDFDARPSRGRRPTCTAPTSTPPPTSSWNRSTSPGRTRSSSGRCR